MMNYQTLYNEIVRRGVHPALGSGSKLNHNIEQNPHEAAVFFEAMLDLGVTSALELGTGAHGGLARFMVEFLGWQVVSVDKNSPWGYPDKGLFIQTDTVNARDNFTEGQFDLVFIDADHAYGSAQWDYLNYVFVARKAIAFHDIAGLRDCEGVARLWGELHERPGKYEVIENSPQAAGIGWLVLDEYAPPHTQWHEHDNHEVPKSLVFSLDETREDFNHLPDVGKEVHHAPIESVDSPQTPKGKRRSAKGGD